MIAGTSRILDAAVLQNPVAVALRDLALRSVPRFEPMRARLEGFISETSIAYRESSAVCDAGGDGTLRAGDRAPDADLAGGGTLLGGLEAGRHLAVTVGASAPVETARLAVRTLDREDVDAATALAYGLGTLAVIRPDGYVGFRGSAADAASFGAYAASVGLGTAIADV